MIRKFAMAAGFTTVLSAAFLFLAAATTQAQTPDSQPPATPPAAQQPATPPQADTSQTSDEDTISRRRKVKVHDYRNWNFNLGVGASLVNGTTKTFVKNGGPEGEAGVARNFSKYFGFRADFMWANLPLRDSALQLAQAPGANSHVYAFMLDPIINIPVTSKYSGYLLFGPGFFHRSGKLDSSTVVLGSPCNAFWNWWGTCYAGSVPLNRNYLSENQNSLGLNLGGGVVRKWRGNKELYAEFRYLHGSHNNDTTALRPITIGIRW
jgi:hypothetical protein